MASNISKEEIKNIIDEIERTFGIKDEIDVSQLNELLENKKIKEVVEMIGKQLGLPVGLNVQLTDNFETRQLATTYASVVESIAAQVLIPGNLPFYGTKELANYPITVKISPNCFQHPKSLFMVLAHELSHVLLHSIRYKEKDNEIYTDILAMILGFLSVYDKGRKTGTITYGYLSDEQFKFAKNQIYLKLRKARKEKGNLISKITLFRNLSVKLKRRMLLFNDLLDFISKHYNNLHFSQVDALKITTFFQIGYIDRFESTQENLERRVSKIESHHFESSFANLANLRTYLEEMEKIISEEKELYRQVEDNIWTIIKYLPLSYKISKVFELGKI